MKNKILSILIVGSIISCRVRQSVYTPKKASGLDTIDVTYQKTPLSLPMILGKRMGFYEKAFTQGNPPRNFKFHEIPPGPQQTEAIASGSLDFAGVIGTTSVILAAINGIDIKIIGMSFRAPETFVIQTLDPLIQNISDLRGKKVAGPRGTNLHHLLIAALKQEGMSINDVEFISMKFPEAFSSMINGNVDAALIGGSIIAKGIDRGARILATGQGLLSSAAAAIITRSEIVKNYPELVHAYLDAQRKSVKAILKYEEDAVRFTSEELGISEENVREMMKFYDYDTDIRQLDKDQLRKTQEFLIDNGLMSADKAINTDNLFYQP